jgi:hypothetical protein
VRDFILQFNEGEQVKAAAPAKKSRAKAAA